MQYGCLKNLLKYCNNVFVHFGSHWQSTFSLVLVFGFVFGSVSVEQRTCWNYYLSRFSFQFNSWHICDCAYALVRVRQKNHVLGVRSSSSFGVKCLALSPQTRPENVPTSLLKISGGFTLVNVETPPQACSFRCSLLLADSPLMEGDCTAIS